MTTNHEPTAEQWRQLNEWIKTATGIDLDDDTERLVTFTEISLRKQGAGDAYRRTGQKKYAEVSARCDGMLDAMMERARDGKSLYLKPSELNAFLAGNKL